MSRIWIREPSPTNPGADVQWKDDSLLFTMQMDGGLTTADIYIQSAGDEDGWYVVETITDDPKGSLCDTYRNSKSAARFIPATGAVQQLAAGAPTRIALRVFPSFTEA